MEAYNRSIAIVGMPTILLTIDSLRADHLGQYGYERQTMPALDRLVDDGTVFEQAYSNGPYTRISIPSFHTSRYLAYGNVETFPRIAAILRSNGINATAIGTQTGIGMVQGRFGFDEMIDLGRDGFDKGADRSVTEEATVRVDGVAAQISEWLQKNRLDGIYTALKRPYNAVFASEETEQIKGYTSAEAVTDKAISWIENNGESEFFLWLHYMEAHRPYGIHDTDPTYRDGPVDHDRIRELMQKAGRAPETVTESERQLIIDLYDSDLRYCSDHLERLFDSLETEDLWEKSNVILSSDHGEEFREHGLFFHRNFPHDELIHVPLLLKPSTQTRRAVEPPETVGQQRTLLDLAPTICSFYDIESSEYGFLGTPLYEGNERDVIAIGQPGMDVPAVAVRADGWKYIHTESERRLFDLSTDPEERENVVESNQDIARRLRRKIPERLFDRDTKTPRPPEDDVDRKQLEALGYMELRDEKG